MRDVLRCRLLLALSRGGVASWMTVGRWRGLLRRAAIGRAGAIEAEVREMEVAAGGDVVEGAMRCESVGGSSWRWTRMRLMRLEVLAKVKTRAEMRRRFHCSQSRSQPVSVDVQGRRQNKHTQTQRHTTWGGAATAVGKTTARCSGQGGDGGARQDALVAVLRWQAGSLDGGPATRERQGPTYGAGCWVNCISRPLGLALVRPSSPREAPHRPGPDVHLHDLTRTARGQQSPPPVKDDSARLPWFRGGANC